MIDTFAIRCNVLKLAFSGQLSQHEIEDGSVDDMLKRVNPNREIKQEKAGPYEIPEHWAWVKLEDLYEINPKVEASDDTDAAFIPMERIAQVFLIRLLSKRKSGALHQRIIPDLLMVMWHLPKSLLALKTENLLLQQDCRMELAEEQRN